VRSGGGGYAIDIDRVDVDAVRFEDLADRAASQDRIPRLENALGLWRGPAFGEFAELPVVRGEALRLEELRLTVTEQLVEARLDAGEEGRTIAELEALIAAHPLREQFWRQLMLALYRVGRQAEALRRGTELRAMLRDQLGLSLSPAAQALEAQIAADDPSLLRSTRREPRATELTLAWREPTQLIGRADDLAAVRAMIVDRPIVSICGPGGVGKTRLAMAVAASCAEQFAQVGVVELASLRDRTERSRSSRPRSTSSSVSI
jgi:DNA-binding SARP family transcriptional activator